MSAIGSVTAAAGAATGTGQTGSADFQQFMQDWMQNSLLNAMGDVQSMEEKHSQALQEQRENDNGPG